MLLYSKGDETIGLTTFKCHFISFSDIFNANIRPVTVETYIVSFANTGEDTLGPTFLTHKSEGLRGILEADTPVRIALPRNIFHESLSDTPNACFPINNVNFGYPKKNLYYYISCLPVYFFGLPSCNYLVDTQTTTNYQDFLGICLIHTNSSLMYRRRYSVQLITSQEYSGS